MTDTVFAILLAAGFSSRFGNQNKLLAPFRGKPLVRHTLDLVCGMRCFNRILFVYADEDVALVARDYIIAGQVTPVFNSAPQHGQGESVRLGVSAAFTPTAGPESAYYLFFPCDQPLLDAATVRLILDAARPGSIVEPVCRDYRGSPSLFSAAFHDDLIALKPGEVPRLLKLRYPQAVIQVDVPERAALEDIDTPADLTRLS